MDCHLCWKWPPPPRPWWCKFCNMGALLDSLPLLIAQVTGSRYGNCIPFKIRRTLSRLLRAWLNSELMTVIHSTQGCLVQTLQAGQNAAAKLLVGTFIEENVIPVLSAHCQFIVESNPKCWKIIRSQTNLFFSRQASPYQTHNNKVADKDIRDSLLDLWSHEFVPAPQKSNSLGSITKGHI